MFQIVYTWPVYVYLLNGSLLIGIRRWLDDRNTRWCVTEYTYMQRLRLRAIKFNSEWENSMKWSMVLFAIYRKYSKMRWIRDEWQMRVIETNNASASFISAQFTWVWNLYNWVSANVHRTTKWLPILYELFCCFVSEEILFDSLMVNANDRWVTSNERSRLCALNVDKPNVELSRGTLNTHIGNKFYSMFMTC